MPPLPVAPPLRAPPELPLLEPVPVPPAPEWSPPAPRPPLDPPSGAALLVTKAEPLHARAANPKPTETANKKVDRIAK
jgi:hypothetical protein